MEYIICHYHEIGLKGKNRRFFEEKLVENIKRALPFSFGSVKRISGRILISLNKKGLENQEMIEQGLKDVFGIANFSFASSSKQEITAIKNKALELLQNEKFKTFRITAQRSDKRFHLTSQKINEKVGEHIVKKLRKKVKLEKPDLTCFIEIVEKYAFLYLKKIKGPGGLPVGVSEKACLLISGGIDSPVAGFQMLKRGVKIDFIHFHSYPYTSKASIEKVKETVKLLNKYQFASRLFLVPFGDIQREILLKTPAKLRVVLYRRMMLRISQEIAEKEKALALVTGESVGQVASQTLQNIRVISRSIDMPVLRPLIGFDKEEIINLAKKIGTFDISILPYEDCCSRFVPKHPATRAQLKEVEKAESKINVQKLVKDALKNVDIGT